MSGSPIVLVADADRDAREIFAAILRHSGYVPVVAEDGREALRLASLHRPAALVMDLALPELDGLSLIREVRSTERTSSTRIVVVSSRPATGLQRAARQVGCDEFLVKPVRPSSVLASIRRLLGDVPPPSSMPGSEAGLPPARE